MKTEKNFWVGVPADKTDQWRQAFEGQNDILVSSPCPVCCKATLRHYYHLARPETRELRGRRYVGRGGYWQWCAGCGAYEHSSSLIPADWLGAVLPVNHALLTPLPIELEEAVAAINLQCGKTSLGSTPQNG